MQIFGILFRIVCFKINSTSFQLYAIFSNFTKNVPIVVTEGSSVKGVSQRQRDSVRADQR